MGLAMELTDRTTIIGVLGVTMFADTMFLHLDCTMLLGRSRYTQVEELN